MSCSPGSDTRSPASAVPDFAPMTMRTPPRSERRPSRSPQRAPLVPSDASPTSVLASALGGLTLRDSSSPVVKRFTQQAGSTGTRLLTDSTNRSIYAMDPSTPPGSDRNPAVPQAPPPHERANSFDELAMLAVSSGITEVSMSIQEVSTLIFEIQELRHASSTTVARTRPNQADAATDEHGLSPNGVSEMDKALINLDARLDDVRRELGDIQLRVEPLLGSVSGTEADRSSEARSLEGKWKSTLEEWDCVQKDAEMLGEEMKEDKWLVVFNSVIKQAEDMMRSLDKILNQSHQFVSEVNGRRGQCVSSTASDFAFNRSLAGTSASPIDSSATSFSAAVSSANPTLAHLGPDDIQPLLSSFVALHRSLHAKVKYYSPACDRVLKILGKGIADRSTKNGEVLRRYADMKARWRGLLDRIVKVEAEMRSIEDWFKGAAVTDETAEAKGKEQDRDSTSDLANTLTPPKEPPARRISPLRRLANKMSPNSTPTRPDRFFRQASLGPASPPANSSVLPSNLAIPTSPPVASDSAPVSTPPRPPESVQRSRGASPSSTRLPPAAAPPRTPQSRPPLSHRRSSSALSASVGPSGRPIPRRAISPMPTPGASLADRPRWNPSTKRTDEEREVLAQSALGNGRPSLAPRPGGGTPLANRNGRNSSIGLRPSSRLSMNSSMSRSYTGARPVSPAFSDASSVVRERPSTPSRIPRPSSVIRPRSTTPHSAYDSSASTSIMQRMASSPATSTLPLTSRSRPPVSSNRYSLSRSAGPSAFSMPRSSSASLLPTASSLSPPRAVSPSPSATSSSSRLYRGQTPEPSLVAHAQRLSHVRAPGPRPSPGPRMSYMHATTPRAANPPARPPSSLAYGGRAGAVSPLPNGESTAAAYVANVHDPLDLAVGDIVNALPLALHVERVDAPLTRADAGRVELYSSRYLFSLGPPAVAVEQQHTRNARGAVMLKLVDRVGPRARKGDKKVLARVGGGWQDLESHCLSLLAQAI